MTKTSYTISTTALIGIIFMMCNTAALAVSDIASKILRTDLSSGLIVFLYKFGLLIITLPWILYGGTQHIKTKRLHFHILRAFFGTFGAISFTQGLKFISMADAAAFENLQYIIVVLLSVVFFDDRLTRTKIAALIMGFIGAYVIVNPSILKGYLESSRSSSQVDGVFKYGYTALAICCWAVNSLLVKVLGNTEHNKTQMFYVLIFSSLWAIPSAFVKWEIIDVLGNQIPVRPTFYDPGILALSMPHVFLLSLMGLCYFIHGVCYFNALKHDLSIVIPFRYTKLIFSGMLGYAIFSEEVDSFALVGYLLIMSSSFMLVNYEVNKRRKKKLSA